MSTIIHPQDVVGGDSDPYFAHSEDRFQQVIDELHQNPVRDHQEFPGLASLLEDYINPKVDVPHEQYLRRLLKVFKDSVTDYTYSKTLNRLTEDERYRVQQFVEEGKPAAIVGDDYHVGTSFAAREELPDLSEPHWSLENLAEDIKDVIGKIFHDVRIYEDVEHKARVPVFIHQDFQNWGRTVKNTPKITCVPRSSYGVQQIVKYAKQHDLNVRASGYRHSWSPVFGKTGQILISTLGLVRATKLPNIESLPGSQIFQPHTDLSSIEMIGAPEKGKNRLVRVGTAVTNQQFRRWCNTRSIDEQSTLPLNVIMVEITLGGSNGPICHGAGRRHKTLSDLVHTIEYVDCDGNLQTISKDKDPEFMKTASGCFGLLGIVTHLTLEVEPMSYAILTPQKLPVMKAIPPPPGLKDEDIPPTLRIKMTAEERAQAQAEFEKHARDNFYSEWFWFPYTSVVWVNCWDNVEDETGAVDYPSNGQVFCQFVQTVLINILQRSEAIFGLQRVLPFLQTTLISKLGVDVMPDSITDPSQKIKTRVPNALHFRRCIQNVRVRDMEIEIPLQPVKGSLKDAKFDDPIDFAIAQTAFWDAILTAYKHTDTSPQRMPLEMRITGPSNVTLAPYNGFNLGAASIEVLTLEVMKDEWHPYAQEVLDLWMSYKDKDGKYLNSRPHFAKEWYPFSVRGQPMVEYLRDSYKDAIGEFQTNMQAIATRQGWNLGEARKRFSNDLFEELFYKPLVQHSVVQPKSQVSVTVTDINEAVSV